MYFGVCVFDHFCCLGCLRLSGFCWLFYIVCLLIWFKLLCFVDFAFVLIDYLVFYLCLSLFEYCCLLVWVVAFNFWVCVCFKVCGFYEFMVCDCFDCLVCYCCWYLLDCFGLMIMCLLRIFVVLIDVCLLLWHLILLVLFYVYCVFDGSFSCGSLRWLH